MGRDIAGDFWEPVMMASECCTAPAVAEPKQTPLPGARAALILLLTINLFNYIDRTVLAAVAPHIRRELLATDDDRVARFKIGLLSSAFLITYMVLSPIFGWLADRMSRWWLVGVGVVFWSLASGASGLDWKIGLLGPYAMLLLTRCFVGVGEAAYGPAAPTMIADLYPLSIRGRVMSWFFLAIPVGSALGFTLGGQVARLPDWGWRWAFYLVVAPGLLLGLLCFLMREPPRGGADPLRVRPRRARLQDLLSLARTPSYVLDTLGMTAMTFSLMGLAYWMPDYLEGRQVDDLYLFGLGPIAPTTFFGGLTALAGLLATLLGGIAGDMLRKRFAGSYFLVSGISMLVGFPMVLLVILTPFPLAWLMIFLAAFCLLFNTGPTNTILANVTHPAIRATAFAVNIFILHALGDVISPPLLGWIAGVFHSMDAAFVVISLMTLVGGVLWLWGARYLARDTALAPTRLDEPGPRS